MKPTPESDPDAYALAVQLLARREHSQKELQQKLERKGCDANAIAAALQRLAAAGWQDEQRYAEAYVRSRIARGFGELRIVGELQQRGLRKDLISSVLAEMAPDWADIARKLYASRYAGKTNSLDFAEQQKRLRFMLSRGFSRADLRRLFSAVDEQEFD